MTSYFIGQKAGAVAISPHGEKAIVSDREAIAVFDRRAKNNVGWFRDLANEPKFLEYDASGEHFLSAGMGEVKIIRSSDLAEVAKATEIPANVTITGVAMSHDRKKAFVCGNYSFAAILDCQTAKILNRFQIDDGGGGNAECVGAAWLDNEKKVVTAIGKSLFLFDVASAQAAAKWDTGAKSSLTCLTATPHVIACGTVEGELIFMDLKNPQKPEALPFTNDYIFSITASPDARLIVLRLHDWFEAMEIHSRKVVWKIGKPGSLKPGALALSHSGDVAAFAVIDKVKSESRILFVNPKDGTELA